MLHQRRQVRVRYRPSSSASRATGLPNAILPYTGSTREAEGQPLHVANRSRSHIRSEAGYANIQHACTLFAHTPSILSARSVLKNVLSILLSFRS
jgi:hypothetical protein